MSDTQFKPLGTRLLVKRNAAESEQPTSIIALPEISKKPVNRATVTALGPDVKNKQLLGAEILLPMYGVTELKDVGEDVLILDESEVIGGWFPKNDIFGYYTVTPQLGRGALDPNPSSTCVSPPCDGCFTPQVCERSDAREANDGDEEISTQQQ